MSKPWTLYFNLLFVHFLLLTVLAWLGVGWSQIPIKVLDGNGKLWSGIFVANLLPWIFLFLAPKALRYLRTIRPMWKVAGMFFGIQAGIAMLGYPAAFGGIPKVLHSIANVDGMAVATVTRKMDYSDRYERCSPRIEISGVFVLDSNICVSPELFQNIKVGDQVAMFGKLSLYAIEPIRIERLTLRSRRTP